MCGKTVKNYKTLITCFVCWGRTEYMRICSLASNGTQDNEGEYVLPNPSSKWRLVQNSNEDFYARLTH